MANQITDGRTLVHAANVATPYDNLAGFAAGNLDTDVFIQGTGAIGEIISSSRNGVLYDAGSAQNWANNVFYIWINCGIVGLLATKASAGFTIRFCGNTVTDWFEVYVGGSDSWPPAVSGGWVQFVVDIEDARTAAGVGTVGGTNGTSPATNAIRYVGWSGITASVMTKMVDNTWMDEIRRLPDGSPGIIVEGRNGGSTDWNFADIFTQLGAGTGTFRPGAGGSFVVNTPIQFGINDTSAHGFTDTNQLILWSDQEFAPTDLYSISALGNSGGTTNVVMGAKTGTGDAATGAQGCIIAAASTGVRWAMDFDDPNLDSIDLYGCTFIHGGDAQLDDPSVECISTQFIDCSSVTQSSSAVNSCLFLKNKIIDANTADGVGFLSCYTVADVKYNSFEFSDGHGITITNNAGSPFTLLGNLFSSYGANDTNDAAVYNNSGSSIVINVTGGVASPTVRTLANTTVNNNVSITFTNLQNPTEVRVYLTGTLTVVDGQEDVTTGTFAFSVGSGVAVDIRIFAIGYYPADLINYSTTSNVSIPISQVFDRTYLNP